MGKSTIIAMLTLPEGNYLELPPSGFQHPTKNLGFISTSGAAAILPMCAFQLHRSKWPITWMIFREFDHKIGIR